MPAGPRGRKPKGEVRETDHWCTERELTKALGRFDLDPCSNPRSNVNARVSLMLENGDDGLAFDWTWYSVYCNPPYSLVMPWAEKLYAHQSPWVALVKLDPTTKWWAKLVSTPWSLKWAPFRRRLRFELPGKTQTANFPSALIWHAWEPSAELKEWLWPEVVRS